MAWSKGKIIYTPPETVALNLSGGEKWLTLASPLFNAGVDSFGCDALLHLFEPSGNIGLIASKGPFNLDGQRGFQFYVRKDYKCLGLRINDGQDYFAEWLSAENSLPAWDAPYHTTFSLDRNGEPWFSINGVAYTGFYGLGDFGLGDLGLGFAADPWDYPGSLDNDEPLRIAGFDGVQGGLPCYLNFIRFDFGRAIGIDFYHEVWNRVRYGFPRDDDDFKRDFFAAWNYQNTLLDLVATYELTLNGGAALYAAGWPHSESPLEVVFENNFDWGRILTYLEQADFNRTLSGAAQNYLDAARKQNPRMDFRYISHAQSTALMAAHLSGNEVAFYQRADWPRTCRGIIRTPPEFSEEPARIDGLPTYSGSLEIEAV